MTLAAAFTLLVIVVVLVLMMADLSPPDVALFGGVIVLAAAGVISPQQALAGFANPGMLTVAALFVVAAGLRQTGVVTQVTAAVLGRPGTERQALARLVAPVIATSAVLNNTTIVATLLPAVHDWARRINIAPSRLLLPLSFASILGGTCTLIGTSTNLVVAGLVIDMAPETPGLRELTMFDITPVGVATALAGGLMLVLLGPWLLPDRRASVSAADDPREYTMELLIPEGSRLVGRSIETAGLRHLPGAYLMEIIRDEHVLAVVNGQEPLAAKDRLIFVGELDAMVDLQRLPGVSAAPDQVFKLEGPRLQRHIVEAVVSARNPMVGRSIREGGFRTHYHAVVIGVARSGERVGGRLGDIILRNGDVLLLEADAAFVQLQRTRSDFVLVSSVSGASPPRFERALAAGAILAGFVVVSTLEWMPTVISASLAAGLMVVFRACTVQEARRSLDLTVLVAIASAFGLGSAMQATGLDQAMANLAVDMGASSPMLALIAVYVVTTLLTEVVTNNAAAVLALPIGISMAASVGAQPMPFVIVVMMAASASFLSPIGYQTNLMVFNAGGYRAIDYPRLGLPMSITAGVTTLVTVPWFFPL